MLLLLLSAYVIPFAEADILNWHPANFNNTINKANQIVEYPFVYRKNIHSFNDENVSHAIKYGSSSQMNLRGIQKRVRDQEEACNSNLKNGVGLMRQFPIFKHDCMPLNTNNNRIIAEKQNFKGSRPQKGPREGRPKSQSRTERVRHKGQSRSSDRDEKGLLSIIEVVQFDNAECLSSGGVSGRCYHEFECARMSGTAFGGCQKGFGVCCVLQHTCGDETASTRSWFTNPGFPTPSSERLACSFTIYKASEDILQLRVEFEAFEVQPPTQGTCADDQFLISGQNVNSIVPIICGINNMQHIYFQVDEASGPFYLSLQTAKEGPRLFSIKITQLKAGDALLAPSHCLQYFEGETGSFETFNYQDKSNIAVNKQTSYFNNLNYAICIARLRGFCTISYKNVDTNDEEYQFQLANVDKEGNALIPPNQAGAEIFNCPDDYIVVNGIRLCGDKLNDAATIDDFTVNSPVTEISTGPIIFIFRSNEKVVGKGFRLFYKQNMCMSL